MLTLDFATTVTRFDSLLGAHRGGYDRPLTAVEKFLAARERNLLVLERNFSVRGEIGELGDRDQFLFGYTWRSSESDGTPGTFNAIIGGVTDTFFAVKTELDRGQGRTANGIDDDAPPSFFIDLADDNGEAYVGVLNGMPAPYWFRQLPIAIEDLTEATLEPFLGT